MTDETFLSIYFYKIRTPSNLILINLALAEFLIAIVGVPMDVFPLLNGEWIPGEYWCIATGTVVTTSGICNFKLISTLIKRIKLMSDVIHEKMFALFVV